MRGYLDKQLNDLRTKFDQRKQLQRWRKKIETIRDASIQQSAEQVATEENIDIGHHICQLKTCDNLLAALPPRRDATYSDCVAMPHCCWIGLEPSNVRFQKNPANRYSPSECSFAEASCTTIVER